MGLLFGLADRQYKQAVTEPVPPLFPVLVMTGETAQIVWWKDLEQFLEEHPNHSFLVPADRQRQVREQIENNTRSQKTPVDFNRNSPLPWSATFDSKPSGHGRDSFRVDATYDDDRANIGYYEATEKQVFPKFYTYYFGPGLILLYLPAALLINFLCWLAPRFVIRFLKKKRAALA